MSEPWGGPAPYQPATPPPPHYGQPEPAPAGPGPQHFGYPAPAGPAPRDFGQPESGSGNAPRHYGQPAPAAGNVPQHYGHAEPAPGYALQPYGVPAQLARAVPDAGQPAYLLVGAGGRLGALLLDFLLIMLTLGVGWLIWTLVTWANGQTPAKQLLGHVVADPNTGAPFSWGAMFLREFVIRGLLFGLVNMITFGVFSFVDAFMVFRADHRTAHDLVSGSVVRHR